ncbi:MAG: hypothetical protein ABSF44_06825 [Candidatus Bathyarchaeia archaeon]
MTSDKFQDIINGWCIPAVKRHAIAKWNCPQGHEFLRCEAHFLLYTRAFKGNPIMNYIGVDIG